MDAMINGRTPEEIKKGLKMHAQGERCVEDGAYCPYYALCKKRFPPVMRDAIAMIERLESERDEALAKVPKWISVEERLPEKPGEYGAYASGMHLVLGFDENEDWFDEEYFNYNESITNWMPLPEPPKEVNDEHQAGPV